MTRPVRIVDAHHHLWDLEAVHYPWLMERGTPRFFGDPTPIQNNYLCTDLRVDIGTLPVETSVHIQVGADLSDSLNETIWVDSQADAHGLPTAIVAFADLEAGNLGHVLDRQMAASQRVKGIRQIISRSSGEDSVAGTASLLQSAEFAAGLALVASRNLSFDLQLTPPHLQDAASVFGAIDGLQVALCHAGSLQDFSDDGWRQWQLGLTELARAVPGLCKISGHGMFNHAWTDDDIRTLVLKAIDVYSPDRVAFGSNFPVDRLYASYSRVWEAFFRATEDFSDDDREKMFATNAEEFYRLAC